MCWVGERRPRNFRICIQVTAEHLIRRDDGGGAGGGASSSAVQRLNELTKHQTRLGNPPAE